MKRYLSLLLIVLTVLTLAFCLFACKKDEDIGEVNLDNIKFTDKSVQYTGKSKNLVIKGKLPKGVKVSYEGNGKIEVGEYTVTAKFTKNGVEIPDSSKTATLTITLGAYDLSQTMSFEDTTVPYNGQVQRLEINGTLPEGVSVAYDYHGKTPNAPGVYEVTANFTRTNENYREIPSQTKTLTIVPAPIDMSNVTFEGTTSYFNGVAREFKREDIKNLPDVLNVSFEGNSVVGIGTHTVTAIFESTDPNYAAPAPMSVTVTVLPGRYYTTKLTYEEFGDGYAVTGYSGDLNYIVIPSTHNGKNVIAIKDGAFSGNSTLSYVYIPETVKSIGANAFNGCAALSELHLSPEIETLGEGAFKGCVALTSIVLSDKLTVIPASAFEGCTSLESIKLGSAVTSLGESAFKGCTALKSIYIPATITDIASSSVENAPFFGCSSELMIVVGVNTKLSGFGSYWASISSDTTALVVYSKSYEQYIEIGDDFRNFAKDDAGLNKIIIGNSELTHADFIQDSNNNTVYTRTEYCSYSIGYPEISAIPSSDLAEVIVEQATSANGGIATITITSSDRTKTVTYKITVILLSDTN